MSYLEQEQGVASDAAVKVNLFRWIGRRIGLWRQLTGATAWRCLTKRGFGVLLGGTPVAALGLVFLLSACAESRSPEVRYKISVEVDTPEGVRTGSSIWSFQLRPGGLVSPYDSRFRGEAVLVELPGGNALFGLLVGQNERGDLVHGSMPMLPETVYRRLGITREVERQALGDRVKVLNYIRQQPAQRIVLDCSAQECPLLVRFRDLRNPASVAAVPPYELDGAFGTGYRLRRITFETTDQRPQFHLEQRLAWLNTGPESSLKPGHSATDFSLPAVLHNYDFQRRLD